MAEDTLIAKVGGYAFEGWTAVSCDRSLDQVAGGFEIGFTERWPGRPEEWRIPAGAPCQILLGDDPLVTGYVDQADYSLDPGQHPLRVEGRDKTGDLVDCSAIHQPSSWKGRTIQQIAADLCAPFGIKVSVAGPVGAPFPSFALQHGETVFAALDRLAKQRALLLATNELGDLELRRPGAERGDYELVLGQNFKAARFTNDVKDRFSQYIVKGHPSFGGGSGFEPGSSEEAVKGPSATSADAGVPRYRPLVIMNDETGPGSTLADRAAWEATTRAGRAQVLVGTVTGWRTPSGEPYRIDRLVDVQARALGVEDELLVKAVRFTLGEGGGQLTELTLTRKEAYSLMALPAKVTKGSKSRKGSGSAGVDPVIGLS